MEISTILNRDFYTSLRKKGHSHLQIIESIFPPERKEKFISDVADLESTDLTNTKKETPKSTRKPKPNTAQGEKPGYKKPTRKKK